MLTYIVVFHDRAAAGLRLSIEEKAGIARRLRGIAGLRRAFLHTPVQARDPCLNDGPSPQLALQLYFDAMADLEASLCRPGPLHELAASGALPLLHRAEVAQQAMLARDFAVPEPGRIGDGTVSCSYLVGYPGPARDLNAWLMHYISHHPTLMARLPGIRGIEVCTRIDYCSALPWVRADHMLRNSVVFDSAAALTAALHSAVRREMREDFERFPPYCGGSTHYAMERLEILP